MINRKCSPSSNASGRQQGSSEGICRGPRCRPLPQVPRWRDLWLSWWERLRNAHRTVAPAPSYLATCGRPAALQCCDVMGSGLCHHPSAGLSCAGCACNRPAAPLPAAVSNDDLVAAEGYAGLLGICMPSAPLHRICIFSVYHPAMYAYGRSCIGAGNGCAPAVCMRGLLFRTKKHCRCSS